MSRDNRFQRKEFYVEDFRQAIANLFNKYFVGGLDKIDGFNSNRVEQTHTLAAVKKMEAAIYIALDETENKTHAERYAKYLKKHEEIMQKFREQALSLVDSGDLIAQEIGKTLRLTGWLESDTREDWENE